MKRRVSLTVNIVREGKVIDVRRRTRVYGPAKVVIDERTAPHHPLWPEIYVVGHGVKHRKWPPYIIVLGEGEHLTAGYWESHKPQAPGAPSFRHLRFTNLPVTVFPPDEVARQALIGG